MDNKEKLGTLVIKKDLSMSNIWIITKVDNIQVKEVYGFHSKPTFTRQEATYYLDITLDQVNKYKYVNLAILRILMGLKVWYIINH